jgi:HlyD family secretion protein
MPLIVETQKVTTGDISNELMTSGSVVSEEIKYYFQEVNAKVHELMVKTGDAVEKDQILVTYDTSQLESELYKLQLQQGASGADYAGTLAKDKESTIKVTDATNNINNVEPMIEFQEQHVKDLRNNLSKAQTDERKKLTDSQYQLNIQISNVQYEIANVTHTPEEITALQVQLKNLSQSLQSVTNQLTTIDMNDSYIKMQKELEEQESVLAGLKTFLAEQEAIKNTSQPTVLTGYNKEQLSNNKTLTDYNVSELEQNIQKAKEGLKAEFHGIVTDVQAVEGATLMSGASVLTLANAEELKVSYFVIQV